jgi:Ala-tRNA(Pro) deacylase
MINYDGRRFRPITHGVHADAAVALYRQEGGLVWAEFTGGEVRKGSLSGLRAANGNLEFTYSMVLADGEVVAGRCRSTPQILADGRIRLHETWERYGPHADSGVSVLDEIPGAGTASRNHDTRCAGPAPGTQSGTGHDVLPAQSTHGRLVGLLDASGSRYRLIEHAPEGRTDVASALRGHPLAQASKCIVVRVSATKKKGRYLLAVVPGNKRIDLERLSELVQGRGAAFAAHHVAERLTGCVSGSIPPFSFTTELRVVVDKGLLVHDELFFNAARLDVSVALRTEDYLTLVTPWIEDIVLEPADGDMPAPAHQGGHPWRRNARAQAVCQ